jgi:hypothetical protein
MKFYIICNGYNLKTFDEIVMLFSDRLFSDRRVKIEYVVTDYLVTDYVVTYVSLHRICL